MIQYFKRFKEFIPTWVICVFLFFWIFIWPLIIAIVLFIIQCFQKREINKKLSLIDQNTTDDAFVINEQNATDDETNEKIHSLLKLLRENDDELKKCHEQIQYLSEANKKDTSILNQELKSLHEEVNTKDSIINGLNQTLDEIKEQETKKTSFPEGQYLVGRDIPLGGYTLVSKNGSGSVELYPTYAKFRKEEDDIIWESVKGEYKISLMENGNYLVVRGADIYPDDTNIIQKNVMDIEINAIREELRLLNNNCVQAYYIFSNYDDITSEDCKNQLVLLKQKEKDMRNSESDISVDNDNSGKRVEARIIRQMLRTFNAECDNVLRNLSVKNIDVMRNKIQKSYESINLLYSSNGISLTSSILQLKLEEATLLYTFELKRQQEKEIQKSIKEQMLEEARAAKEIEEKKKKIEKDLQQHLGEINRLMKYMKNTQIDAEKQIYIDKINKLEAKIKELESDKETVIEREANAKAGYVYIISNIGSFGDDIYKIGMTRRLEPMDRIKELSSASVPFEFDVHAMIFSSDAPELENMLHQYFADKAVNKVNPRKEFFNVSIDEIEKVVKENYNDTVQFTKIPVAAEYRQSLNL